MSEATEAAQVLEDTADYLLVNGVHRDGGFGVKGGSRCVLGVFSDLAAEGRQTLDAHLALLERVGSVPPWNDATTDDFEVIDTLRMVAKDLRNAAVTS